MEDKNFVFSVITPIYNVEEYLEEAIESVINQTIGFKENIQLILVNDGSPDESYKICERYRDEYPDNIVYIKKENGGVSQTRNVGLEHVKGKYIVFLDGDDRWEDTAFKIIEEFFDAHYDEIDLCACRMKYFGDFEKKVHPLDYKYQTGNRIVDLDQEPLYINTTLGNAVFKAASLKDKRFKEDLKYGEDSFLVNTVAAEKRAVGIVADAVFYYRKNNVGGNASVNITRRREWYFDVPRLYYKGLLDYMKEHFGCVPRVFQETVFYDIKWRRYNREAMSKLTDEEKEQHLQLLSEILQDIDDDVIMKSSKINIFRKLYFMNLKYGKNIFSESELKKDVYSYNGTRLLNLKAKQMVSVRVIDVYDDVLSITGVLKFSFIGRPYNFYAVDSGNGDKIYHPVIKKNNRWDEKGITGEVLIEGETFNVKIPVKPGSVISFYLEMDGNTIRIRPKVIKKSGVMSTYNYAYNTFGDYIIRYVDGRFEVLKRGFVSEALAERRYRKSIKEKSGPAKLKIHDNNKRDKDRIRRARLKKQVAFVTIRSDDCLLDNMDRVYNMLDVPKAICAKRKMAYRADELMEAKELMSTSKVVVTDDYLFLMKQKKKGQKYVQLWHAAGAGKHFGQDATTMLLDEDAQYHRHYDAVTVASKNIRDVYAQAFRIPVDRIYATGVARTDLFFDEEHKEAARKRVYEQYPQLKDKSIILFTPTFRDIPGIRRAVYDPHIDFDKLSAVLKEDQIFVARPHPVMITPLVKEEYPNIIEIRDINTNDLMIVSDLLISDYSSTMFEYSLLKKPMAFYCYDFDDYDRDFYIDFEKELPGPLLRTQEELLEYLSRGEYPLMKSFEEFHEKYVGACDGHSTERIVELIKQLLEEK